MTGYKSTTIIKYIGINIIFVVYKPGIPYSFRSLAPHEVIVKTGL
jgi:hypothetical protein